MTPVQVLEPTPSGVRDSLRADDVPVTTVRPGDVVRVTSLDAWGQLERPARPGEPGRSIFADRRGHCLTGPIHVEGARRGQVLAVRLLRLTCAPWGFTVAGGRPTPVHQRLGVADADAAWLLWDIDAQSGRATNQYGDVVRIAPFLGVIGVAPAHGERSTVPPQGDTAGNIDCASLTAGSTLYIPVVSDRTLLYLGDGHAAQGDGEVGGTAIECGMTTDVEIGLLDQAPLDAVHAVTPDARITFGFDSSLDEAAGQALEQMVTWLEHLLDRDRATCLAVASVVVDLRVTQIANQVWGVHAVLAHDRLSSLHGARP